MTMLNSRDEIEDWLIEMNISRYIIKDDLTVDVHSCVDLEKNNIDFIPIQFGVVHDFFDCSGNNLVSLKGSPHTVLGAFDCSDNKLVSLINGPKSVLNNFCCNSNKLTSLDGCPETVGAEFWCYYNKIDSIQQQHLPLKFDHFYFFQALEIPELKSLYQKDLTVSCSFAQLKKIFDSYNLSQQLQIELPQKDNTRKIKI